MKNPQKYVYLIDFFLSKRGGLNAFNSDLIFNINEIEHNDIDSKEKLSEMLEDFKRDEVFINNSVFKRVIRDFKIKNDIVTIYDLTKLKLKEYRQMIINNEIDLTARHKISLLIPLGTKWEDITIKFVDGHEVDIITKGIKGKIIKSNYSEMGFRNSKTRKPNVQWDLLKKLSENNGELSWDSPNANDKIKKRKQILSKKLKACFQIAEDPFHEYCKTKSYKIKFDLLSEHDSYSEKLENEKKDPLEIQEFLRDQTPTVYDKNENRKDE